VRPAASKALKLVAACAVCLAVVTGLAFLFRRLF
jgi:hypothetical protein